ncbi:hypothetical protein [Ferrimonas futtsuensis]|uniref:hypothetical protein n=1 Tax=Ferrimonas futtsuensis TaxID=364764 RepID=UPI00041FDE26|nr:hypothetical protein [Ferrimonas futtsuensis]
MSSLKKLKKLARAGKFQKRLARAEQPLRSINPELRAVTLQAGQSAVRELMAPLNPLLSWFNEGGIDFSAADSSSRQIQSIRQPARPLSMLPLKSPPCKRCPALMGGQCKCAVKKFAS